MKKPYGDLIVLFHVAYIHLIVFLALITYKKSPPGDLLTWERTWKPLENILLPVCETTFVIEYAQDL